MIELQDIGPPGPPTAVYVHIPFCRDRCVYCAFPTVADNPAEHAALIAAVLTEATSWAEQLPPLHSLYIGGGTPGLLSTGELERLIGGLGSSGKLAPGGELTLELNPTNVSLESLPSWNQLGINRLSIGIQTFNDRALRQLARRHDSSEAQRAAALLAEHWPHTWSADLLVGWPGQTTEDARSDVRELLQFEPPHVSVYGLTVEPRTPLARQEAAGQVVTAPMETFPDLDDAWSEGLQAAGLERYEVSNFSRSGHRSRHNQAYWANRSYLGLGPGAASSMHPLRWSNIRDSGDYVRWIGRGHSAREHCERLTPRARLLESLAIGLRTRDGISTEGLDLRFGLAWRELVIQARDRSLSANILHLDNKRLYIDPENLVRVDRIVSELVDHFGRALPEDETSKIYSVGE